MAVRTIILPEQNSIYIRYPERVIADDIRDALAFAMAHPDFSFEYRVFKDGTDLVDLDLQYQDVLEMLNLANSAYEDAVCILHMSFCAPRDAVFGVARMYTSLAEHSTSVVATVSRDFAASAQAVGFDPESMAHLLETQG